MIPACAVYVGYLWFTWTRPAVIQQLIIEQLHEQLGNVEITVESAHLRLFGGISVRNLRITRLDDPSGQPFLIVPSARLIHDKELLAKRKLRLRKVELDSPQIRIERLLDGTFNLPQLLGSGDLSEPVPTFVIRNASLTVYDAAAGPKPVGTLQAEYLTIVNDPLTVLSIEGRGTGQPLGPFRFNGKVQRLNDRFAVQMELPRIVLDHTLLSTVASYAPEVAEHVDRVRGIAKVELMVGYDPTARPALHHETRIEIYDGRIEHPKLPLPLEKVEIRASCHDGQLTVEHATARAGDAQITAALELLPPQTDAAMPTMPLSFGQGEMLPEVLEKRLQRVEVHLNHLTLNQALFSRMPQSLRDVHEMIMPQGPISLTLLMQRQPTGWTKRAILKPQGVSAVYEKFPFPLTDIRGTVDYVMTSLDTERVDVDLVAMGAGRKMQLKGYYAEEAGRDQLDFRIQGNDMPLTDELVRALPDKAEKFVRQLNATAFGDLTATFRIAPGSKKLIKEFRLQVRNGRMRYAMFPYELEQVRGLIIIRPRPNDLTAASSDEEDDMSLDDVVELQGFQAMHGNGSISLSGRKGPSPQGSTLKLEIEGRAIPLDAAMQQALTGLRLDDVWAELRPSGTTNTSIEVRIHDRPKPAPTPNQVRRVGFQVPITELPFDAINDLEVTATVAGGALHPTFFPYRLTEFGGRLEYARGKVDLKQLRGRHGASRVVLERGELRPRPDGGVWADLRNLTTPSLPVDADLIAAFPTGMRESVAALKLSGAVDLVLTQFVIDVPGTKKNLEVVPASFASPIPKQDARQAIVYWDGTLTLNGNSFQAGLPWENVIGQFASHGRYEGDRFGRVVANMLLDEVRISKQPLRDLQARLEIDPKTPQAVRIPKIQGKLFGGEVGGSALLLVGGQTPLFDLKLNATRVQLEEVARAQKLGPKAKLEGLATAQLFLSNRAEGNVATAMYGGGSVDVPSGKMLNLPVMLDLFKLLNLRVPDQTAFEEAHAMFELQGDKVRFSQLDLMGNAISLGGEGEINFATGRTEFEFYTIWSRWLKGWLQTPVGELAAEISSMLFKIEVNGQMGGELNYRKVTVPVILDPVRKVVDRMRQSNLYQQGEGPTNGN